MLDTKQLGQRIRKIQCRASRNIAGVRKKENHTVFLLFHKISKAMAVNLVLFEFVGVGLRNAHVVARPLNNLIEILRDV